MITLKNAREYALRWVKWLANGYAAEIVIKSNLEASGRQYGAGYLEVRSCLLDKEKGNSIPLNPWQPTFRDAKCGFNLSGLEFGNSKFHT